MRTTIKIDDALLAEAKIHAARTGRTMTEVVEDALRMSLARSAARTRPRADLPTFSGSALLPGVDLDDSAALIDLMEGTNR
jgi:Arc/MetJ family transcription regulator